jgi:glycine dehydrogenase subunit 1
LDGHHILIEWIPFRSDGSLDVETGIKLIDDQTAALLLQYPNFFGIIDDIKEIASHAKTCGTLSIICANPLAYALYASAAELGADIAVGDAQPFGLPLQYGGPYIGYIACKQPLVRQLPGRIVGETVDAKNRRGFVLTLQAREQQIRREKATSNICTNQSLAALASLIAILWYGKEGIRKLSLTNYQRASYLRSELAKIPGVTVGNAPIFNEFVAVFPKSIDKVVSHFRRCGIEPGLSLERYYPEKNGSLLIAVTETKSKQMLDNYVNISKKLINEHGV